MSSRSRDWGPHQLQVKMLEDVCMWGFIAAGGGERGSLKLRLRLLAERRCEGMSASAPALVIGGHSSSSGSCEKECGCGSVLQRTFGGEEVQAALETVHRGAQ